MPLVLLILLYFSYFFHFNMNEYLAQPSKYLNSACNDTISTSSHFSGLFQSFICGKKLDKNLHKETLIKSGIYHLIVVSGGHFLFLESVFNILKLPVLVRSFLLFLYYLTTGLQAPGLRALIHLLMAKLIFKHSHHNTSQLNLVFISGLVCLILNCEYWASLSFWLSFSVSIALTTSQSLFYQEKPINRFFLQNLTIYAFLFPFLLKLSYSHPINIFVGSLLVTPTFLFLVFSGAVLFLLEVSSLSSLVSDYDQVIQYYFKFLEQMGSFSFDKNHALWDWSLFWVYLLLLFIISHFLKLQIERRSVHV